MSKNKKNSKGNGNKKHAIETVYLDVPNLITHKGNCKKVMMFPDRYKCLGDDLIELSKQLDELIGVEGAKNIKKCPYCYK